MSGEAYEFLDVDPAPEPERREAWFVGIDNGCYEGKEAPLAICDHEWDARFLASIIDMSGRLSYCDKAPVWPFRSVRHKGEAA